MNNSNTADPLNISVGEVAYKERPSLSQGSQLKLRVLIENR
jgi:hypothetical protein